MRPKIGLLALGNQLFAPGFLEGRSVCCAFMREDRELCTYYRFHKQKIIFFLSAMRDYAKELKAHKIDVHYEELHQDSEPYEQRLIKWIATNKITRLLFFEIEDKFFEQRIHAVLRQNSVAFEVLPSPMFLTSREQFKAYLDKNKKPFMKTFYERQRKALKILIDAKGQPAGGRWSFDEMNRQPLPKTVTPPAIPSVRATPAVKAVTELCAKHFADHPGDANAPWLPTDRKAAHAWLDVFIEDRLANFGPYEDAISPRSEFVFHSVLSPLLNTGLLTPGEVIEAVIQCKKINIASIEGFVRQVIGWREFVRGIYQSFSERQETTNFWQHHRQLTPAWYDGTTGIEPLDHVIRKVHTRGWAHHIERLMVVGNMMLLLEIEPQAAHAWFMEMFVDSSNWVMGPNVYGMGIFSDGGIFATKPYICGSNYYRKMGGYKRAAWCDAVDGLYWGFVEKHAAFFSKNPRLSMMVRTVEKMDVQRKSKIFAAAEALKSRITLPSS